MHGGNLAWAANIAGCSPRSLLDFSASINPLGPPASVRVAIQGALSELQHYPDPEYSSLRAALGAHHRLSPDWVLPGNGAAELLTWAARDMGLTGKGSYPRAVLLAPAFGDYQRALHSFGVEVMPWAILAPGGEPVHRSLAPLIEGRTAGVSCIINNPHNPTGHLWTTQDLVPLLDHFSLVVVDEAFMDFVPPAQTESLVPWVEAYPNLVVVRSLTKFYSLPGLRLGYALGHPDRLQRWQQWRDPWPVNGLAVAAAIAAVADHGFQAQTWQWLPPTRQALWEGLAAMPGLQPLVGTANYLLVRADQSVLPQQEHLLKHDQILIRDCLSFAELGDRYFRVAVRSNDENERLLTALAELQAL